LRASPTVACILCVPRRGAVRDRCVPATRRALVATHCAAQVDAAVLGEGLDVELYGELARLAAGPFAALFSGPPAATA